MSTAPGHSLLALPRFRRDPLGTLLAAARQEGDVVRFSFGPLRLHLVAHPRDVQRVLVDHASNYDKESVGYGKLRLALGDGLLTAGGEAWRRRRRVIQPAFHRDRIALFGEVVTSSTDRMLDAWRPGQPLDAATAMMQLTLDIICRAMFSTDTTDKTALLGQLMTTAIHYINDRMMALSSVFEFPEKLPTPANRRFREAIATGDALVRELVEERRAKPEDPRDLLSMLLALRDSETGEGLTDVELRDEVITIFAAGHETTANLLAWTWHLLARNPDIEARLSEECERVLTGRCPAPADVERLPFTTAIVKEAMRLYPPAWVMSRRAIEADVLGGFDVPAGAAVLVSPYVTQRHPELWDDPDRFDPERFLDGRERSLPRFAYFPFGGGQRLCIGKELAMMESVLIVARVAQRFRLHADPDHVVPPEPLVTLRPRGALVMTPIAKA